MPPRNQRCRIFCSRFRRRIRFFRHFQRIWPRFFHARELLFTARPKRVAVIILSTPHLARSGSVGPGGARRTKVAVLSDERKT